MGKNFLKKQLYDHFYPLFIITLTILLVNRNLILKHGYFENEDSFGGHTALISFFSEDLRFIDVWNETSFGFFSPLNFIKFLAIFAKLFSGITVFNISIVLSMFIAGFSMYFLAYHFTKNKLASFISSFVFLYNQWIVAKYSSGHLMHIYPYALLPLLFYTLYQSLKTEKLKHIVTFSLILSIYPFMRMDPLYYVFPFVVLFFILFIIYNPGFDAVKKVIKVSLISGFLFFLLVAFIFIPVLKIPTIFSTVKYPIWEIKFYSLNLFNSLLGHTTSIYGNIYWIGKLSWKSNPLLSLLLYKLSMLIIPIFAFLSILFRKDFITIFLIVTALISIFLAKGPLEPLEGIYLWAYNNLPYFGGLHTPNRWLLLTLFSYSTLVGFTVNELEKKIKLRVKPYNPTTLVIIMVIIVSIIYNSWYIFTHGYKTYQLENSEIEPHLFLKNNPKEEYRIITIPFHQGYMFYSDGSRGHDIGRSSYYFHKKPVINTISGVKFNHPVIDFYNFIKSRIIKKDTKYLSKILGIYDVKYVVVQGYPPTAPNAIDRLTYKQHEFIEKQHGLKKLFKSNATPYLLKFADRWPPEIVKYNLTLKYNYLFVNRSAKVYENLYRIPRIFSPKGTIFVVGGLETLKKLAEINSFNFSDWNLIFINQIDNKSVLKEIIENSDYILIVNSELNDLIIPLSSMSIKLHENEDWKFNYKPIIDGYNIISREIIYTNKKNAKIMFNIDVNRHSEIWIRVFIHEKGGKISIKINNKTKIINTTTYRESLGFKWFKICELESEKYLLTIENLFGENYIDEIVILDKNKYKKIEKLLKQEKKIIYIIDLEKIALLNIPLEKVYNEEILFDDNWIESLWSPAFYPKVDITYSVNRISGNYSLMVNINPRPSGAEILYKRFYDMENWSGLEFISFWFKGIDSRNAFNLWIFFNNSKWPNVQALRYRFLDINKSWIKIIIPINKPNAVYGKVEWDKVSRIAFDLPNKNFRGTIYLDRFSIYRGEINRTKLENILNAKVLLFKNSKPLENYTIKPKSERNITYLEFKKFRPSKWIVKVNSTGPYILVFSNTYHKMWRAYVNGKEYRSIPSYYFINSFYINETGEHEVVIEFIGQRIQIISLIISGLAYLFAITYLVYDWRRNDRWTRKLREKLQKYLKIR